MRPIDADALKEKLKTKDAAVMTLLGFFELIDEMPTINHTRIEPKNGKWRTTETLAVCSECGTIFENSQLFGVKFANFCPYCGADMKGV